MLSYWPPKVLFKSLNFINLLLDGSFICIVIKLAKSATLYGKEWLKYTTSPSNGNLY